MAEVSAAHNDLLDLAAVLALLDEMHATIAADYSAGALPWALANRPELARRFQETEAAIDHLAAAGQTRAAFSAALDAHAAVWREMSAQFRSEGVA